MITRDEVLDILKTVEDPELLMSILDLGLVYRVEVTERGVEVDFTLTSPGCPAGEMIQADIVRAVRAAASVEVKANIVWSPPWAPDFMSDEAKLSLGYPI